MQKQNTEVNGKKQPFAAPRLEHRGTLPSLTGDVGVSGSGDL